MNKPVLAAERIQSLDISLNDLAVGTLVRTPGDYNAFNLLPAYRSLNDPPIFSLSLRSGQPLFSFPGRFPGRRLRPSIGRAVDPQVTRGRW